MIGKVARFGSSFLGAIQYCYYETRANHSLDRTRIRGELLYAQHLGISQVTDNSLRTESKQRLDIHAMAAAMKSVAEMNERTRKPVWHQSFSFPIGECPSTDIMIRICQSFAETFEMENNPMVAFRHRDRQHEHFHIIASRVDLDGWNTAQTSFNYREVGRFCRTMETRFNLTPGIPMTADQEAVALSVELPPVNKKVCDEEKQPVLEMEKPASVRTPQRKFKP